MQQGAEITDFPDAGYYRKWKHHKIGTVVRICNEYIVHIRKDGKLDWETDESLDGIVDKLSDEKKKELNDAYCTIVVCEAYSLKGYADDDKTQYLTMLGEAYVHWIENDPTTALKLVAAAKEYYQERSEETSRRWYLGTTIQSSCLFLTAGVVSWLVQAKLIHYIGKSAFHVGLAACAGAVGALFSVIARSGKLKFKASAGKDLHSLEASSHVCAGAISGVIVYLALTSELILGALLKNQHRMDITLLAALAAGSGERLATSIISKFDESAPLSLSGEEFKKKGNTAK